MCVPRVSNGFKGRSGVSVALQQWFSRSFMGNPGVSGVLQEHYRGFQGRSRGFQVIDRGFHGVSECSIEFEGLSGGFKGVIGMFHGISGAFQGFQGCSKRFQVCCRGLHTFSVALKRILGVSQGVSMSFKNVPECIRYVTKGFSGVQGMPFSTDFRGVPGDCSFHIVQAIKKPITY